MLPSWETHSVSKRKQQQEEHFTVSSPKAAVRSPLPCRQPPSFPPPLPTSREHGTVLGMCSLCHPLCQYSTEWNGSKERMREKEGNNIPPWSSCTEPSRWEQGSDWTWFPLEGISFHWLWTGNWKWWLHIVFSSAAAQICNWKDQNQGAFCFCLEWKTCSTGFYN